MLRLLRFSVSNCTGTYERPGSPFSASTLITSAPRSASIAEAKGPGTNIEKSITRLPLRGSQGSARSLKVGRRINHQHLHALARDGEDVLHARGKEAGLARAHLEALGADLDVRPAFEEVADLFDSGVQVRQRAFAFLHLPHQDLELLRADRLRTDETEVPGAGVVGRRIGFHIRLANEVFHGWILRSFTGR